MADEKKIQPSPPIMLDGKGNEIIERCIPPDKAEDDDRVVPPDQEMHVEPAGRNQNAPAKQDYGEPWDWVVEYEDTPFFCMRDRNGGMLFGDGSSHGEYDADFGKGDDPIAIRIKACINALEGVPTEDLKSIAPGWKFLLLMPPGHSGSPQQMDEINSLLKKIVSEEDQDGR